MIALTFAEERKLMALGVPLATVRGNRRYYRIPLAALDRLQEAVAVLEGPWPRQNPPEILRWTAATAVLIEFWRNET